MIKHMIETDLIECTTLLYNYYQYYKKDNNNIFRLSVVCKAYITN